MGVTALYITHDQSEALYLSDHVAILLGGRVVQEGPRRRSTCAPKIFTLPDSLRWRTYSPARLSAPGKVRWRSGTPLGVKLRVATDKDLREGERVVVGIRPFHIELLSAVDCGPGTLSAEVKEMEFTGKDYLITLSISGRTIKARTTPVQYDRIKKDIEKGRVYVHLPEDK